MTIFRNLFKKRRLAPEPQPRRDNSSRFTVSSYAVSDIGQVRANNEDNYLLGTYWNCNAENHSEASVTCQNCNWQVAGVFDGMGGGEAGELASAAAVQSVSKAAYQMTVDISRQDVDLLLRRAFQEANNAVVDLQKRLRIFGTTGTILCTDGTACKVYHAGDSRAYLIRDGEAFPLTKDQTLAQMKIEVGMYDKNDPKAEAEKHKLVEYIGRDRSCENFKPLESQWIPVEKGDGVLLCSDGLYDMCNDGEILQLLLSVDTPQEKATILVNRANANGGIDNATCIYISFT